MSLLSDRVKQSGVKAVEDPASGARVKNSLDAIHPLLLQFINLLPGFVAGTGDARELFFEIRASASGKVFEVFRPVSTRGSEQRAAREQVRAQNLAAAHRGTHFENVVRNIPDASHRCNAAVNRAR